MAYRLQLRIRRDSVRNYIRRRKHLREDLEQSQTTMTGHADMARSVVEPTPMSRRIAAVLVTLYALIALIPMAWIFKVDKCSVLSPMD